MRTVRHAITHDKFKSFTPKAICDATKSTEVLVCLSCESRENVDDMMRKAVTAGGTTYNQPQDHGFMYGHGFQGIDLYGTERVDDAARGCQDERNYMIQKITPCLWFDDNAEEAVKTYTSIFRDSRIGQVTRYEEESAKVSGRPAGTVMTVEFQLEGQHFVALNGGPIFKFNEAISFQVSCKTQEEVDHYWDALSKNGDRDAQQCGWLKDKYGVSWQIVPTALIEMLQDPNPGKRSGVMKAMLQMKKIDIQALKQAHERS